MSEIATVWLDLAKNVSNLIAGLFSCAGPDLDLNLCLLQRAKLPDQRTGRSTLICAQAEGRQRRFLYRKPVPEGEHSNCVLTPADQFITTRKYRQGLI